MVKIVRGNDFRLKIPVEVQTGVDSLGNPILADFDFTGAEVQVSISNMRQKQQVTHSIEGNIVIVPIEGILENGAYDVEITVNKNGNMRSMKKAQFRIVESNEDSDLSSPAEFDVDIHQLESHVLISFGNGSEGGAADYNLLLNQPKINNVTLSGNKSLEQLGIQPKGNYVSDASYVHTDHNFTQELKNKLDSLNDYDDTGIRAELSSLSSSVPTKMSQLTNDRGYVDEVYVNGIVGDINVVLDEINGEVV